MPSPSPYPSGPRNPSKPMAPSTASNTGLSKGSKSAKSEETAAQPPSTTTGVSRTSGQTSASATLGVQGPRDSNLAGSQYHEPNNLAANVLDAAAAGVNRKKQKRRQKQAARLAAEQHQSSESGLTQASMKNGNRSYEGIPYDISVARSQVQATNGYDYGASDYDEPDQYEPGDGEDLYYTDDEGRNSLATDLQSTNGHTAMAYTSHRGLGDKAKKKQVHKAGHVARNDYQSTYAPAKTTPLSTPAGFHPPPPPPPPPLSTAALRSAHHISKDRIWNTSTAEERERIKEFWLSLGEDDRRSLVKVEKEAVLKKMKEQQKHSCSCTVCGRKRTAIEEELEVLYDAYYEELEQYANHQQINLDDGTPIMPPPRMYTHPMARMPSNRNSPQSTTPRFSRSRVQELAEDEDEGDEEDYSDEEDDEEYSEEEVEEEPRRPAADFFNFGNSLTVQGGILTVADDLLKNDGKKFIEMMEQLAERRMQREEEAQFAAAGLRHPSMQPHGHGPSLDDDGYDDDDDEEYDSQEEEDYEEDEMVETMTEEQRMEEGRRMFQIFAARMFEQRVLTAYREKVARERQQKLIEELEEESRLDTQREAKKAKEAQKKKDKKRQQKQVKEEEKAKREAERAAEEAAAKAIEDKKLEEQRQKKEEQRKKKEAEKKAHDEERQRKEAEKQRRLQEAREQQVELERKQREQKEREKKKRDDAKKQEREEREAKEKELRDKKDHEAIERKSRNARSKVEKEVKDQVRKEEQIAKQAAPSRTSPSKRNVPMSAIPMQPIRLVPQTSSSHASPHLQIATPVVPKAPTSVRPRQASHQGSHGSSPKTSQAPSGSSTTSPRLSSIQHSGAAPIPAKAAGQPPPLHHPQPTSTIPPIQAPPGMVSQPPSGFPGMGFSSSYGPTMPAMMQRTPISHESTMYSHQPPYNGPQYRNFMVPNGLQFQPGLNGMRTLPHGRSGAMEPPMAQSSTAPVSMGNASIVNQYGISRDTMPSHSHSRHASASFDRSSFDTPNISAQTQPIARPAPIKRPSSVAPQQQVDETRAHSTADVDDLSNHLGSSALLDDTDVALSSTVGGGRRGSLAPGAPRSGRHGFGASPLFPDPNGSTKIDNFARAGNGNTWGASQMPFGNSTVAGSSSWSNAPGAGWSSNNAFGVIGGSNRPNASRPVMIRMLVCQACKQMTISSPLHGSNGFHSVEAVLHQVEQMKPGNETPIQLKEMLDICDTEGNIQNGGGSFIIQTHEPGGTFVKFEAGGNLNNVSRSGGGPGDIGSPVQQSGSLMAAFGGPRPFQAPGSIMTPTGF